MPGIKLQSEYNDLDKYQYNDGSILYYKKDTKIWHNPYGPAFIWEDGSKFYYIDDKNHRLDGPAVILKDGREEYWINYEFLSKEEFEKHPERLKFLCKEHLVCLC